MPKLVVFTVGYGYELVVASVLDHFAFVEDSDVIAKTAGGQSVRDKDCGLIPYYIAEAFIYVCFCNGVECSSRLIEDEERSVFIQRTCKCDLLQLAARKVNTVVDKPTVDVGINAFGEFSYFIAQADTF